MRYTLLAVTLSVVSLAAGACSKEPKPGDPPPAPIADVDRTAPAPAPAAVPRGPERPVFSLVDNRLLMHVERGGGLVALPGSAGFAKYMKFGKPNPAKPQWKVKQTKDDRAVGLAEAYAAIMVPLTAEQAAAKVVHVRIHVAAPRRVTVMVNGKQAQNTELAAGWQTLSATIPDGMLRAGENDLQLALGKGEPAAVEWIQFGGAAPGEAPIVTYDAAARALLLAEGTALVYYVMIPKDGRLVGDVAAPCSVAVEARAAEGAPVTGQLAGAGSAVELGALAGKVARLRLSPAAGCPQARLTGAALAVPGAAPTVQKPKKPRHVVFWIMDSLRADRVKPFFPAARPEVPTFTALAL
jgi:hypothetical protein